MGELRIEGLGVEVPTGCLVGGRWRAGPAPFDVLDKYRLAPCARVDGADADLAREAVTEAAAAFERGFPAARERAGILLDVRDAVAARAADFRALMVAEAGFPARDADTEVRRALETLTLSAEEAKRLGGESVPFDGAPGGAGRIGFTLRFPLGLVVAITPFNSPLNTVCHKVGPAFAGGNAVVLKPSDRTPLTASLLGECFREGGAPAGSLSILHGGVPLARALLDDPRPALYAFTGSTEAGRAIQAAAGVRRTQMELGSIAATIVLDDADVALAAEKCANASFRKAGQVCTSIQMLIVQDGVHDAFRAAYLERAAALVAGDPADPATDVGPLISKAAARRVAALFEGRTIALGGTREGAVIAPTVLEDLADDDPALTGEIFGPVACLLRVPDLKTAIGRVNATPYGLASGVFTNDVGAAFRAARELRVGAVHVNETSSSRVDLMPYGGVKDSGFGHEGPRYAVREMTAERLVTFSGLGS